MANSFAIQVVFKGLDQMTEPLRKATAGLDKMKAKLDALKKSSAEMVSAGRAMAGAGLAMSAGIGYGLKKFADFEISKVKAQNALSTKSGLPKEMESLTREAVKLGNKLPGSTQDMLELLTAMKQAGASTQNLTSGAFNAGAHLYALQGIVEGLGASEFGAMFQKIQNGLGVTGDKAAVMADQIQRLKTASGATIHDVTEGVTNVAPALHALGMTGINESKSTLTVLGMLMKRGMSGASAGTSMRMMLDQLAPIQAKIAGGDTKGARASFGQSALAKAGITFDAFDQKTGKFGGWSQLFKITGDILKMNNEMERSAAITGLWGAKAAKAISAMSPEAFNQMTSAMNDQESMDQRMDRMLNTLTMSWEALTGSVTNLVVTAFAPLGPVIKNIANFLNTIVGKVEEFASKNQKLFGAISIVVSGLAAFITVTGGAMWAIGRLTAAYVNNIGMISKFTNKLVAASPWLLAIAAIGLLFYANWDTVAPIMNDVADSLGEAANGVMELITALNPFTDASGQAKKDMDGMAAVAWVLAKAISVIATGIEAVVAGLKTFKVLASGGVENPLTMMKEGMTALTGEGKGGILDRISGAKGVFDKHFSLGGAIDNVTKPWEKIAGRDIFGVAKGLYGDSEKPATPGSAATANTAAATTKEAVKDRMEKTAFGNMSPRPVGGTSMPMSITVNVPPGADGKAIGDQVMSAFRDRAPEFAAILQREQQVAMRGAY